MSLWISVLPGVYGICIVCVVTYFSLFFLTSYKFLQCPSRFLSPERRTTPTSLAVCVGDLILFPAQPAASGSLLWGPCRVNKRGRGAPVRTQCQGGSWHHRSFSGCEHSIASRIGAFKHRERLEGVEGRAAGIRTDSAIGVREPRSESREWACFFYSSLPPPYIYFIISIFTYFFYFI